MKDLAEASYQFFRPYIHPYRWAPDKPNHGPRNKEIEAAIRDKGKPGCCTFYRKNGDYKLRILQPWVFTRAIANHRKVYYTSRDRHLLPCLDIDIHRPGQTFDDAKQAAQTIDDSFRGFFGSNVIHWWESARGMHGYLLVNNPFPPDRANGILLSLAAQIRRLLTEVDFEIKGTISCMHTDGTFHGGTYCTLPIHNEWTWDQLELFRQLPRVTTVQLQGLLDHLQGEENRNDASATTETAREDVGHGSNPDGTGQASVESGVQSRTCSNGMERTVLPGFIRNHPTGRSRRPARPVLREEPNSYVRQLHALLARSRELRRVPSVEEALQYIKERGYFTPPWERNEQHRRRRVESNLRYISRTFDPSKCEGSYLNLDGYMTWCEDCFSDRECVRLPVDYVNSAAGVLDFLLTVDPNEDGTLPRKRVEAFWKALRKEGLLPVPWNNDRWTMFTILARRRDVVRVSESYAKGKAMKWTRGAKFPYVRMAG
jgi:hypothetical protein